MEFDQNLGGACTFSIGQDWIKKIFPMKKECQRRHNDMETESYTRGMENSPAQPKMSKTQINSFVKAHIS